MITVLLFASLKDLIGEPLLRMPIAQAPTPHHVFKNLALRSPEFERLRSVIRIAVNHNYADWHVPLSAGDEVALFPPVSGGCG